MSKVAYVGTYGKPNGSAGGIYVYNVEPDNRTWTLLQTVETPNPSFLCFNSQKTSLFAVNELNKIPMENGLISSFNVSQSDGCLTLSSSKSTNGIWPCHLCFDQSLQYLFIANYGSGSVACIKVNRSGLLEDQTDLLVHEGPLGSNQERQEAPHTHMVNTLLSPDGKQHLQVVDLGLDKVVQYEFDPDVGKIGTPTKASWKAASGAGPRHSVMSKDGRFLYVINELDSTISTFPYKMEENLPSIQTVSTLPTDCTSTSFTSEIMLHHSGKFIYGANRGHDSIVIFSIDQASGLLTLVGHCSTNGKTPRHFQIEKDYLYVGNQDSNTITIFKIDCETGELTNTNNVVEVPSPVCIIFK